MKEQFTDLLRSLSWAQLRFWLGLCAYNPIIMAYSDSFVHL